MAGEQIRSEQQDGLELESESAVDEPRQWRAHDPDLTSNDGQEPGEQLLAPGAGLAAEDDEPTAIAEDVGLAYPGGAESQAVRIDEES